MQVNYTNTFLKSYKKRIAASEKLKTQFQERLFLFNTDRTSPILKDHKPAGKKSEYRAFSITGDIRVIYKIFGDRVLFYDISIHNQVY